MTDLPASTPVVIRVGLGFDYNDGGISNQKLALLGLVINASRMPDPADRFIYLPRIYSRDQDESKSTFHAFGDVFWTEIFVEFLNRWGVGIVPIPAVEYADRIERGGWNHFHLGAAHLGSIAEKEETAATDIISDFCRSLVPRIRSSTLFQALCSEIFHKNNLSVMAQFRIEGDWASYCRYNLDPVLVRPEQNYLTPVEICTKIKRSLPDVKQLYVFCDERYAPQPKHLINQAVEDATGIRLFWKTDFMDPETYRNMSAIDASLIDFEISKLASTFIGLSRSTFSNMSAFERFSENFASLSHDYIYNLPQENLGLRVDKGTRVDPWETCGLPWPN
ncbi:hypothetical protein C8J35_1058 [Rhizobium sp. PP-F2F-G38]|nr:hypothetical protein C8J37_1068 [Rhizobium sp. PP-WC-1G-195]PYE96902.1 hypothetical protein C8J35_1058 [Rhizobium sp. PP-F2F-G38]